MVKAISSQSMTKISEAKLTLTEVPYTDCLYQCLELLSDH